MRLVTSCLLLLPTLAFQTLTKRSSPRRVQILFDATSNVDDDDDLSSLVTSRLPTSVADQVRQATKSLLLATNDGTYRHAVRLLLPVIGATELDDWPGGARQMMQAAEPLLLDVLRGLGAQTTNKFLIDASDGVYAIMAEAKQARDDCCTVLLPSADTVDNLLQLDGQVGDKRNLILVNPQWKRRSDFGGGLGFFGRSDKGVDYAEQFVPTFSLTNLICEGESIRILRTHPGPWRVFVRKEEGGVVDWVLIGNKDFVESKPDEWSSQPANQRDGGRLFDYGLPTYQEINGMLLDTPNYAPKNPAERAAAAFNFIKDTL